MADNSNWQLELELEPEATAGARAGALPARQAVTVDNWETDIWRVPHLRRWNGNT